MYVRVCVFCQATIYTVFLTPLLSLNPRSQSVIHEIALKEAELVEKKDCDLSEALALIAECPVQIEMAIKSFSKTCSFLFSLLCDGCLTPE